MTEAPPSPGTPPLARVTPSASASRIKHPSSRVPGTASAGTARTKGKVPVRHGLSADVAVYAAVRPSAATSPR